MDFRTRMDNERRATHRLFLEKHVDNRDLVALTLAGPSQVLATGGLREAVLGRTAYIGDIDAMVRRVTNGQFQRAEQLIQSAAQPEDLEFPTALDAWRLVGCDVPLLADARDMRSAYEARLRDEAEGADAERAREMLRTEEEKMARRNARWMVPALLQAQEEEGEEEEEEEGGSGTNLLPDGAATMEALWRLHSPPAPAWMREIAATLREWGFVYYRTRGLARRYGGGGGEDWLEAWGQLRGEAGGRFAEPTTPAGRSTMRATMYAIHGGGDKNKVLLLNRELWPELDGGPLAAGDAAEEELRAHFQTYRASMGEGHLQNTFIVVDGSVVPRASEWMLGDGVGGFWVWAYDADWNPEENKGDAEGEGEGEGEVYEGQVRVSLLSLDGWFYAARWEGVAMRDMWAKAQRHPLKMWECYTKPLEEWDHESFV